MALVVRSMKIPRRSVLGVGGALAVAAPVSLLFWPRDRGAAAPGRRPLRPDPESILDLPEGFSYVVIDRAQSRMSDGYRSPGLPDGMACFQGPPGTWVLMRNHELEHGSGQGPFQAGPRPREVYDPEGDGSVTRLVVDQKTLRLRSSNLALSGTLRNCAGGPSPWGYLSCEETVEPRHGYVFRCATDRDRIQPPEKIAGYGRFRHEAVAIDARDHAAYLTEDQPDGCLYRFRPHHLQDPFQGRLQAMRVVGAPGLETRTGMRVREHHPVDWVDVPDPDPGEDSVRSQARELGAALICRGEGIWFHEDAVTFTATTGGALGSGQVFRLHLPEGQPGRLELLAESTDSSTLDCPDNVTVAPWGDVYVAEDGPGVQYVRGISPEGRLFDVAQNARSRGEMAGVCFSPDGGTLFLNLQNDGLTLGVRGPFRSLST